MVKYACKVTSSRCLSQFFTAVHEDVPKCMPKNTCPLSCKARYSRVRIPPYAKAYRQRFGRFVLRDAKRTVHEIVCENVFIQRFVIIRQSEKCFGTPRRAMQKRALPENGYRVILNSAKRFLSALCRRHSNFQPLLLHE